MIIYNDGRLPQDLTVDDLLDSNRSRPHNPLIAGVFFRSGQIEAWGRGISMIKSVCEAWDKPVPLFRYRFGDEFSVTFFDNNRDTDKDTEKDTENINVNEPDINYGCFITNADIVKRVDARQNRIMRLMADEPYITIKMISNKISINERNVKKRIKVLKDAGLIERSGSDRSGKWIVK